MKSLLHGYLQFRKGNGVYSLLCKLFLDTLDYDAQMNLKIDPEKDLNKLTLRADQIFPISQAMLLEKDSSSGISSIPRQNVINELFESKIDRSTR